MTPLAGVSRNATHPARTVYARPAYTSIKPTVYPKPGYTEVMERVRQNGVSFFDVVRPKPGRTVAFWQGWLWNEVSFDVSKPTVRKIQRIFAENSLRVIDEANFPSII